MTGNKRAATVASALFALLFALSAWTARDTFATRAERGGAGGRHFVTHLCPMGDYDKLRGLMVIWRGRTAMVAERPWLCLSPTEQAMMVEALVAQRGGVRGALGGKDAMLEVVGAESGRRLAVAESGEVTTFD